MAPHDSLRTILLDRVRARAQRRTDRVDLQVARFQLMAVHLGNTQREIQDIDRMAHPA
ncbi:hypothetical protein NITLEN_20417 [Nitrospira lenta]|uniref:Uncharacterized protein n=1 Tax=Nitrospira lenta TaxID=1436998 RepID=A0A330L513_9BACT|nr:hypothetical protein NITLEN_20417 [Nitrospira lenta]